MNKDELWNDEDFGKEFIIFSRADMEDTSMYDEDVSVIYIEAFYETISDITNRWNKARKHILVNKIVRCFGTPNDSDSIQNHASLYLDMGARLYNCMKQAYENGWKYVKVLKISNSRNKFDVQYYASEYKLIVQKNLPVNFTKKKPGKK